MTDVFALAGLGAAIRAAPLIDVYVNVLPFADHRTAILAAINKGVDAGGARVILPYIGGYSINDTITVTASNIHVILRDTVTLTKLTKASAFRFVGNFSVHIENCALIGEGKVRRINCNGAAMKANGYTYTEGVDVDYAGVCFKYVRDSICENVEIDGGLVNSLEFFGCRRPVARRVRALNAVFDNNISFNFDPGDTTWSDTDPNTWCNGLAEDCYASGAESLGMTSYASTGTKFVRCVSVANGNDNTSLPHNGGGFSAEADPFSAGGSFATRNHRVQFIDCAANDNWNAGINITANGTECLNSTMANTKAPANRPNSTAAYGSNWIVFGTGSLKATACKSKGGGGSGVFALVANGNFPFVDWDGEIDGPAGHGIYGSGITRVTTSTRSRITSTGGRGVYVLNSGAGFNPGAGDADINGWIEATGTLAVEIDGIDGGVVRQLRCKNIGNTLVPAVRFRSTQRATIGEIANRDANVRVTNILELQSTVVRANVGRVTGDSINARVLNNAGSTNYAFAQDVGYDLALREVAAATVAGGAAVAGRNTRPLGTTALNRAINSNGTLIATAISGGAFTLAAGTYRLWASAPAYKVDEHKLYLRNVTDGVDIDGGTAAYASAASDVMTESRLDVVFTLNAAKSLRLEHYCQTARTTDGLGRAMTTQSAVFAELRVRQVA